MISTEAPKHLSCDIPCSPPCSQEWSLLLPQVGARDLSGPCSKGFDFPNAPARFARFLWENDTLIESHKSGKILADTLLQVRNGG